MSATSSVPCRRPGPKGLVMSSLRRGDRGAVTEIRAAWRRWLIDSPDDDLTTGKHVALDVFDDDLDHAVRAFQQHRGLLVDGVVGEATYRALKEASYRLGARTLAHQFGAPDVRRRRRHPAGPAAGPRLLHRPGRRPLRAADPQRSDVLPARVRPVPRRHLWPRDVALLVLSRLAGDRRLAARHPRGGAGPPLRPAAVGQADHHRSGPRRRRPRAHHATAPTGRSAKQTSCGTWQVGSKAA